MQEKGSGKAGGESGFTLIEVLVACAFIIVLSAIAISSFALYRDGAELAKAQLTLHNARIALEAGLQDLPPGTNFFSSSATDGSPLHGNLQLALPGMAMSKDVMLSLSVLDCGWEDRFMVTMFSYACRPGYVTWYLRTCGGFEMTWPRADGAAC